MDVTCFEAQLKLTVITMLLAQLPRPARFRPHEHTALNNANQSRSAETALSFIISGSAPRKTLSNWGTEGQKTQMTNRQRDRETDNCNYKTRK